MKNNEEYAYLGLKALKRAAKKVLDEAEKNKVNIPIWKDDHIEYVSPNSLKK